MGNLGQDRLDLVKRLYYERQFSAREVALELGVSLNCVYDFMQKHQLERRDNSAQNQVRFERKTPSFSVKENLTVQEQELRAIGTMLYWGEGFQSQNAVAVDFANSKPEMIRLFVKFLRTIFRLDESI